jgi:hypothetical protein
MIDSGKDDPQKHQAMKVTVKMRVGGASSIKLLADAAREPLPSH